MRYLVTSAEMKKYDKTTIEKIGIPSLVLMERAALETFYALEKKGLVQKGKNALILAGFGNNGGDGLALGRMLCEAGMEVVIWLVGEESKASKEWNAQKAILDSYPVRFVKEAPRESFLVVADALFGVGLSREICGAFYEALEIVNRMSGFKLAMDVPSGVNADDGQILGIAFRADLTVTYGFEKMGLYLTPGSLMAGEVKLAQIGISSRAFEEVPPGCFTLDETEEELLPKRRGDGNKGTFGKALVIAGSKNMAGAAILCARACYRMGAGMVKILTSPENRVIIQETIPEAMLGDVSDNGSLLESLAWCDVICIGPGLGKSEDSLRALQTVISTKETNGEKPLVIDADGINLLAENKELLSEISRQGEGGRQITLTPHAGEFLRLWNACFEKIDMQLYKDKPWHYARILSEKLNAVIAAKDARTFVCAKGEATCMNLSGNDGMATAGSGDVLAGMITAMICQKPKGEDKVFLSVCKAVRLHGLRGDDAANRLGKHGVMAGDLIKSEI